jgi:hypothetical protein
MLAIIGMTRVEAIGSSIKDERLMASFTASEIPSRFRSLLN